MAAVLINGAAGWIMAITLSFCISAMDFDEILASTNPPFIQVFLNVTGSASAATALTIFPIIFVRALGYQATHLLFVPRAPRIEEHADFEPPQGFAGILTFMATSSRQLYAFARDNALPFSPWLCKVSSNQIPLNAILVTFTFTCLLSLINLLVGVLPMQPPEEEPY